MTRWGALRLAVTVARLARERVLLRVLLIRPLGYRSRWHLVGWN